MFSQDQQSLQRYVAWFHELDAWTEYWDIYHPETRGRFYFGDGENEPGLLTQFLPREKKPQAFVAWTRMALGLGSEAPFIQAVSRPEVSSAVMAIDALLGRLFATHFGDASESSVQEDYLEAIFRFATNTLPPAVERDARIPPDDPRKSTAGHHTLEGDLMWFAWALQIEAAHTISGVDDQHPRRSLLLAGVATGCGANFAWRAHRRTRSEYRADEATYELLKDRGARWTGDFKSTVDEVHALYRIREWGHE